MPQSSGNGTHAGEAAGLLRVICVGEQTQPLAAEAGSLTRIEPVRVAANVVEAILLSDDRQPWDLIIGAVSQEGAQLEKAVQTLRSVNPGAKIVLLGEPTEEPACRRAVAWGADDYFILPTPLSLILQLSGMANGSRPARATEKTGHNGDGLNGVNGTAHVTDDALAAMMLPAPASGGVVRSPAALMPRNPLEARGQINLLSLPLVVQATLITDILQAKSDISGRLLATLQTYLQWPGALVFVPEARTTEEGGEAPARVTLTAPVMHEGIRYGTLHLESGEGANASQLDQSATWLGSWMAMARRQEQLRALAITDELSGAYNRRYFTRFVEGLIERARAQRFRVSLLLFDIDDFKHYNDQFGHAAGDAIIRAMIKLLRRCTRTSDIVARIGGDEFAVVFWDSEAPRQPNSQHPKDAVAATERFRKAIEGYDWAEDCKIKGQISISGGIATFPWDADTLEALLVKADEAMLQAKRSGKNVIHIHGTERPCE